MKALSNISPPYQTAAIVLWVEDPTTDAYLSECWSGSGDIGIMVAGGCDAVSAVVHHALRAGVPNVFGYRDRDFGPTNRQQWPASDDLRVFRSDAHEVENFLLDSVALASCQLNTAGVTAADVESRLTAFASQMPWWLACRSVLYQVRALTLDQFPSHPGVNAITNQTQAEQYILGSTWTANVGTHVGRLTTTSHVSGLLLAAHATYGPMLASGDWRRQFSGKEVFRNVRDWVYKTPKIPGEDRDADLARAVAREQVRAGSIPEEVMDLRSAIRARAKP